VAEILMQMVYEVLAFQTPGIWMLVSDFVGLFLQNMFLVSGICMDLWEASARAVAEIAKQVPDEDEAAQKKTQQKRARKWIQPIVANYRRNKRGRALIQKQINKVIHLQGRLMPRQAMVDINGKTVSWKIYGKDGTVPMNQLVEKSSLFFDAYLKDFRKHLVYGSKVHSWFEKIERDLSEYSSGLPCTFAPPASSNARR